jgi:hypothetical protein
MHISVRFKTVTVDKTFDPQENVPNIHHDAYASGVITFAAPLLYSVFQSVPLSLITIINRLT